MLSPSGTTYRGAAAIWKYYEKLKDASTTNAANADAPEDETKM